jgi:hypothetical protein
LNPGASTRVGELAAAGPVHDQLVALIRERLGAAAHRDHIASLTKARWIRQVPEGRVESRKLLDSALLSDPADPQILRESAAWWLGDKDAVEGRRRAAERLASACLVSGGDIESSLLLGLLEGRPELLPGRDSALEPRISARLALARAILRPGRFKKNR